MNLQRQVRNVVSITGIGLARADRLAVVNQMEGLCLCFDYRFHRVCLHIVFIDSFQALEAVGNRRFFYGVLIAAVHHKMIISLLVRRTGGGIGPLCCIVFPLIQDEGSPFQRFCGRFGRIYVVIFGQVDISALVVGENPVGQHGLIVCFRSRPGSVFFFLPVRRGQNIARFQGHRNALFWIEQVVVRLFRFINQESIAFKAGHRQDYRINACAFRPGQACDFGFFLFPGFTVHLKFCAGKIPAVLAVHLPDGNLGVHPGILGGHRHILRLVRSGNGIISPFLCRQDLFLPGSYLRLHLGQGESGCSFFLQIVGFVLA